MTLLTAVAVSDRTERVAAAFPRSSDYIRAIAGRNRKNAQQSVSGLYALLLLLRHSGAYSPSLVLSRMPGGKPCIEDSRLHFSVAHSYGLAVCALSDAPVGADTELLRDKPNAAALASRYFSAGEARLVLGSPCPSREFFRVWTRKEALIKLRGGGVDGNLAAVDTLGGSFTERRAFVFGGEYIISVTGDAEYVPTDPCVILSDD